MEKLVNKKVVSIVSSLFILCSLNLFQLEVKSEEMPTSKAKIFSEKTNNIEIEAGQEFIIELKSNPSTGYSWQLANEIDSEVIEMVSSEYKANSNKRADSNMPMVGVGGKDRFVFKGLAEGTTQIKLGYVRPWLNELDKVKPVVFTVTVK